MDYTTRRVQVARCFLPPMGIAISFQTAIAETFFLEGLQCLWNREFIPDLAAWFLS